MRYIGNKTKLLGFIGRVLDRRGIRDGTAVDPFSGTASVARALRQRGFRVIASDIMEYGYVFARAYVQVVAPPTVPALAKLEGLRGDTIGAALAHLDQLAGDPDFIHAHYTPDGIGGREHARMYFTPENGARIDAMRCALERWRARRLIDDDAFFTMLAALIEAADRVANTTGVYAAFVKSWQANAIRPIELRLPRLGRGNGGSARRGDALELARELEPFELLYLDPPYNARQYPGYYHIPELIATGWFDGDVQTRGKTGLVTDPEKRSDWSRSRRCERVFEELVATAPWKRLVMSYNAEGIIPEATIERVLRENGRAGTYKRYRNRYKRYRSDADGENRRYRGDSVYEYLYCVDR